MEKKLKIKKKKQKFKKEIENIEVFYESFTFSCFICAFNRGPTKPIFCSKVAQKGKICSRLLEPQKFAPNAKSCRAPQVTQALW